MSLDNIQLPPFIIQDLFKKSLIDSTPGQSKPLIAKADSFNFLGNNRQNVLILVDNKETAYLPDEELSFLLGILSACKLTMDDVAILNIQKNEQASYQSLTKELKSEKIFLFGIATSQIALPLQIPAYQVQHYNNQVYLCAPELAILQHDKIEKTKLWNCLKQIFSL